MIIRKFLAFLKIIFSYPDGPYKFTVFTVTWAVIGSVLLISAVFATGQTFGQRCSVHFESKSEQWNDCVKTLSKGGKINLPVQIMKIEDIKTVSQAFEYQILYSLRAVEDMAIQRQPPMAELNQFIHLAQMGVDFMVSENLRPNENLIKVTIDQHRGDVRTWANAVRARFHSNKN